jgi:mannose-6-phosphate isomerase-like protein (cupin superfamily)
MSDEPDVVWRVIDGEAFVDLDIRGFEIRSLQMVL